MQAVRALVEGPAIQLTLRVWFAMHAEPLHQRLRSMIVGAAACIHQLKPKAFKPPLNERCHSLGGEPLASVCVVQPPSNVGSAHLLARPEPSDLTDHTAGLRVLQHQHEPARLGETSVLLSRQQSPRVGLSYRSGWRLTFIGSCFIPEGQVVAHVLQRRSSKNELSCSERNHFDVRGHICPRSLAPFCERLIAYPKAVARERGGESALAASQLLPVTRDRFDARYAGYQGRKSRPATSVLPANRACSDAVADRGSFRGQVPQHRLAHVIRASGLGGFETEARAAVDGKVRAWLKSLGCAGVEVHALPASGGFLEDRAAAQRRFQFGSPPTYAERPSSLKFS